MPPRSPSIPPTLVCLALLISSAGAQQQNKEPVWSFLPGPPATPIFLANPAEPRTGLRLDLGATRMRLDLGLALDLIEYSPSHRHRFRAGAFLFTYALTTSSQGLRLQVDAVDGFFGGHIAYRCQMEGSYIRTRLRLLHRSAHFVDGHIDLSTNTWKEGRAPIPFTKDLGELAVAYGMNFGTSQGEIYSGIAYSTLIRPDSLRRFETLHGIQWQTNDTFGSLFGGPFNLYGAYHLSLTGIPEYVGTSSIEAGMKFGSRTGRGIRIFLAFHTGLTAFGQYYDVREDSWSAGFILEVL